MLAGTAFPAASASVTVNASRSSTLRTASPLWYEQSGFRLCGSPAASPAPATSFLSGCGNHRLHHRRFHHLHLHRDRARRRDRRHYSRRCRRRRRRRSAGRIHLRRRHSDFHVENWMPASPRPRSAAISLWLITDPPSCIHCGEHRRPDQRRNWARRQFHAQACSAPSTGAPWSSSAFTLTAARYGSVTVAGTSVSLRLSGTKFSGLTAGCAPVLIGGTSCSVARSESPILLFAHLHRRLFRSYLAPARRPRRQHGPALLARHFALDYFFRSARNTSSPAAASAVRIGTSPSISPRSASTSIRQCWLAFAPSLTDGAAYTATEWLATFQNWQLTAASN